jgi:hypothetical protein
VSNRQRNQAHQRWCGDPDTGTIADVAQPLFNPTWGEAIWGAVMFVVGFFLGKLK